LQAEGHRQSAEEQGVADQLLGQELDDAEGSVDVEDGEQQLDQRPSGQHAGDYQAGKQKQVGVVPEGIGRGREALGADFGRDAGGACFRGAWGVRLLTGHESFSMSAAASSGIISSWWPVMAKPEPPERACGRSTTLTRGR